jgi:hypothetical protein
LCKGKRAIINVVVFVFNKNTDSNYALTGKARIKTATKAMVNSFLFLDNPDTSSNGPGCLNIDMKTIRNAMTMKVVPERNKISTETNVKTHLSLSLTADLATCPPSSMAAGSKLSIVTTIPAHPAYAIGCKNQPLLGGIS